MGKLDGKTAIITGGGRGIGRAIALALAGEGCHVALVSRTKTEIENVASEIEKTGVRGLAIPADISEMDEVKENDHEGKGHPR